MTQAKNLGDVTLLAHLFPFSTSAPFTSSTASSPDTSSSSTVLASSLVVPASPSSASVYLTQILLKLRQYIKQLVVEIL